MKKTISLILTIILLFTFGAFALGSGEDNTSVEKNDQTQTEDTSSDSGRTEIHIGETLNANNLKITYNSVEKWSSNNMFIEPGEGKKFIRLHFSIMNDSDSDKYISSADFNCYADGEKCDESYYGDDTLTFDSLSSGRKISGYIYYEVPVNAGEIEVEYEATFWSNKKAYFIVEL